MKHVFSNSEYLNRLLLLVFPVLLHSCYVPVPLQFQTLYPAQYALHDSLQTIGVLNASLVDSGFSQDDPSPENINADYLRNLLTTEISYSISENLIESPRFHHSESISVRELDPFPMTDNIPPPFDPNDVSVMMEDFETDLLLSLEFFELQNLSNSDNQGISFDSDRNIVLFSSLSSPVYQHNNTTRIVARLYSVSGEQVLQDLILIDTLVWFTSHSFSSAPGEVGEEEDFVFRNSGILLGEEIAAMIAPYWETEERIYYFGTRRDFTQAYLAAYDYNWDEVDSLMMPFTNHRNKKVASIALFNRALSFEMQGKPEEALQMIIRANQLRATTHTRNYLQKLQERVKARETLDDQITN